MKTPVRVNGQVFTLVGDGNSPISVFRYGDKIFDRLRLSLNGRRLGEKAGEERSYAVGILVGLGPENFPEVLKWIWNADPQVQIIQYIAPVTPLGLFPVSRLRGKDQWVYLG